MGAFDPCRVEGRDTPFQMRQSCCPSAQSSPALSGGEETRQAASVSASITCVKTDALHIQQINLTWQEYRTPARLSRLCGKTDVSPYSGPQKSFTVASHGIW